MMSLKTLVIIEFQVVLANYIKIFFKPQPVWKTEKDRELWFVPLES